MRRDALVTQGLTVEVLFLILPNTLLQDWAGPAEAFRIANQAQALQGHPAPFRLRFAGPEAQARSSVGALISGLEPLPRQLNKNSWVVLSGMPGTCLDLNEAAVKASIAWLRTQQESLLRQTEGRRLITICAGALLAAHAGLLRGLRVTTHHQHMDELQQAAPQCCLVANRVFVQDGPVSSSAGITTGIDLALHLISQHCGPALAAQVAQTMVVAMRRGLGDPELSAFLHHRNHLHAAVHRVQDAVSQNPQASWDLSRMAEVAHTSPRHLSRLFAQHAGVAPLHYLRRIRLATAELALQSGQSVTRAAESAGFSSDTQLRRAWLEFGRPESPSSARQSSH